MNDNILLQIETQRIYNRYSALFENCTLKEYSKLSNDLHEEINNAKEQLLSKIKFKRNKDKVTVINEPLLITY